MVEGGTVAGPGTSPARVTSGGESNISVNKTVNVPGLPPLTRREFLNYAWMLAAGGAGAGALWWFFGRGPQVPQNVGAQPNPTAAPTTGATLAPPSSTVNAQPNPSAATINSPAATATLSSKNLLLPAEYINDSPTLKEVMGRKGFDVGTLFRGYNYNDSEWQAVAVNEFNTFVLSAALGWNISEPEPDKFILTLPDTNLSFAEKYGMKIRGVPLISQQSAFMPEWAKSIGKDRSKLASAMQKHIEGVLAHYNGKVREWIVVNEPYRTPFNKFDVLADNYGQDYVDLAFQLAKTADPRIVTLLNHYNNETSSGEFTTIVRDTVKRLKGNIDGVGLQMHLYGTNPPTKLDLVETMKSYGIPVYITELDVNMKNVPGKEEDRLTKQADIYQVAVEAALESGVCKSITMIDLPDKYSWLVRNPPAQGGADAAPTLFFNNYKQKPAHKRVVDVFQTA